MQLNIIQNIDFLNNTLPNKCANLIIADPPYFEVKGGFDFIWANFNEYLKDVEKWAIECNRLLKDNGTLFWYGDSKKIAYTQIIIDKYFNLINNLVWHKGSFMNLENSNLLRSFAPCTERILMYSNDTYNLTNCVYKSRDYIRGEILKAKGEINFKNINTILGTATNGGGVASACFSLHKTSPSMITKDFYLKLQKWCNPHLKTNYEDLKRPFNNVFKLQEVLKFSNEIEVTTKYKHDTVKPEKLTRALIKTCSRKDDVLIVPFAGSGTECAMAIKEGLNFYGFDINKKYCDISNKRVSEILRQPTLF